MSGTRRRKVVLAGLLVPVLGLVPAAASAPITDKAGDTEVDEGQPIAAPRADIVSAQAEMTGTDVVLRYAAAESVDPISDPNWNSDESYTDFYLDTNGDGEAEWDVEYGVSGGALYATVIKVADDSDACEGKAAFENGQYVATVPKDCVGSPASFSYSVETNYDTDAAKPGAPEAYDIAPDDSMAPG